MSAIDVSMVRAQLRSIEQDMGDGGADLAAAIGQLARIVDSLLPLEAEPERDPVPFVDYLPPESGLCEHIRPCWDIECRAGGV